MKSYFLHSAIVISQSSSVSPGKPQMMSVAIVIPGTLSSSVSTTLGRVVPYKNKHTFFKVGDDVLALHSPEHRVRARLHRDVKERVHARVVHRLRDRVEVREDVRRVRHPEPQHAAPVLRKRRRDVSQQPRDVRPEVDPVRARVFARQPYLRDPLRDRGLHASDERLGRVRPELAPRVFGLAVRALAEASRGERHDLHVFVPPNLRQVQRRERLLREHTHGVARERALHGLDDAVDLRDAEEGEVVQFSRVFVALRDCERRGGVQRRSAFTTPTRSYGDQCTARTAAGDHELLPRRFASFDDRVHRALRRVLHRARVDDPQVRVLGRGRQRVPVRAELPGHELGVADVVRAPERSHVHLRASRDDGRGVWTREREVVVVVRLRLIGLVLVVVHVHVLESVRRDVADRGVRRRARAEAAAAPNAARSALGGRAAPRRDDRREVARDADPVRRLRAADILEVFHQGARLVRRHDARRRRRERFGSVQFCSVVALLASSLKPAPPFPSARPEKPTDRGAAAPELDRRFKGPPRDTPPELDVPTGVFSWFITQRARRDISRGSTSVAL
eukprot:29501-Pelagococcus_subviridis.AAC.3